MPETLFSPAIHSPAEDGPLGVEGARPGLVADKHDVHVQQYHNRQVVSVRGIPAVGAFWPDSWYDYVMLVMLGGISERLCCVP